MKLKSCFSDRGMFCGKLSRHFHGGTEKTMEDVDIEVGTRGVKPERLPLYRNPNSSCSRLADAPLNASGLIS
jgi:hypothetical protein